MEFKIKLLGKRPEAKDTKTFIFERPKGFSYLAGQYVYLTLGRLDQPDERGDTRHFTLSSSPTEQHLAITVRMRAQSGYKQTLDKYALGTQISMRGPNGFFTLERDHTATPQIMIAGGIGITPYRSIIKYVVDKNLPVPIQLLHSNSTPEEIVFRGELDNMQHTTKNVRVVYIITKPEKSKVEWTGPTGRIGANLLTRLLPSASSLLPIFWLCGPPRMVSAVEAVFAQMKVPPHRIKTEKFTGY